MFFPERGFFLGLTLLFAFAAVVQAESPPAGRAPQGFGKAKFGASLAEVKAQVPELQPAPPLGGYWGHPDLGRFVLAKVKLEGLKEPVDIEVRFWKDRLWSFIFYTGKNPAADVEAYLAREYGKSPTSGPEGVWLWPGRSLISQSQQGWFTLSDRDIGKEAQRGLDQRAPAGGTGKP